MPAARELAWDGLVGLGHVGVAGPTKDHDADALRVSAQLGEKPVAGLAAPGVELLLCPRRAVEGAIRFPLSEAHGSSRAHKALAPGFVALPHVATSAG